MSSDREERLREALREIRDYAKIHGTASLWAADARDMRLTAEVALDVDGERHDGEEASEDVAALLEGLRKIRDFRAGQSLAPVDTTEMRSLASKALEDVDGD